MMTIYDVKRWIGRIFLEVIYLYLNIHPIF